MMAQTERTGKSLDRTVVILPETDEHTLCVRFTGLIRKEDHKLNLRDRLAAMVEKDGWYSMLIEYKDFVGWEHDAADISLRSIMDFGKFARRLAYVNPPEKKVMQTKLTAPLFGGEMQFFDEGDFDAALEWVRGGG